MTRAWLLGIALAALVLALMAGCWAYTLDYEGDSEPVYQPGTELSVDVDRTKTRAPLKRAEKAPAAPRKAK